MGLHILNPPAPSLFPPTTPFSLGTIRKEEADGWVAGGDTRTKGAGWARALKVGPSLCNPIL